MLKSEYISPETRVFRCEGTGTVLTGSYGENGSPGSNPGQNYLGGF